MRFRFPSQTWDSRIDGKALPAKALKLRKASYLYPGNCTPLHNIVAITGITGNLGAYLFDHFLRNADVLKIYCLNRSRNANERHLEVQADRGLPTDILDSVVGFVQVDFDHERLGLEDDEYVKDATLLVHNAWVSVLGFLMISIEIKAYIVLVLTISSD